MIERDYGQDPNLINGQWTFSRSQPARVRLVRALVVADLRLSDRIFLGFSGYAQTLLVEGVGTDWVDFGIVGGLRLDAVPGAVRTLVRLQIGAVCRVGESLWFTPRVSPTATRSTSMIRWIGYWPAETGFDRNLTGRLVGR